ncbi:hypothetical protein K9M50_00740 [Patescibacteria group bacterium]|nr:hypothetical protein [Patescibacteria group bacterium]
MKTIESFVLKKLFPEKTITIEETNGEKTISESKDVFKSWLDAYFEEWGLNKKQKETEETTVEVLEMVKDADYRTMFSSLSENIDKLCLTQHQIVNFCENHKNCLHPDWATFFLFKENDNYYVANVFVNMGGLSIFIDYLKNEGIWVASISHRVVVPAI